MEIVKKAFEKNKAAKLSENVSDKCAANENRCIICIKNTSCQANNLCHKKEIFSNNFFQFDNYTGENTDSTCVFNNEVKIFNLPKHLSSLRFKIN